MTGCGKTYYLLKMLEDSYRGHFDYIFLICPTFVYNMTYQEWKHKNDPDFLAMPCKQDDVDSYLQRVTWFAKGTNSLIILDDCAGSQFVKNRTSELVNLAFHARLSTIVITQQLTSIAKPYRENISKLVTFYNPSAKDMKALFDEYMADVETQDKSEIVKSLKNNDYARLEILLRRPYGHNIIAP